MPDVIEALGQVLSRDLTRMNLHATHMANINTAGFQSRIDAATPAGHTTSNAARQGRLSATGRPLDIAVIGDGWLVEKAADGALFLTRNGRLHVNNEGVLMSANGHTVQGAQGELFAGTDSAHRIDADGSLRAGNELRGRLLLVKLPTDAQRLPDGRHAVATLPAPQPGARVAAGVIELANVDLAQEMTQLMQTSRHLESTQRALQLYDGVLATGINQIGKD